MTREMLKMLNGEREKAGVEPFIMTEKLEDAAQQRAVETFVLRDHQRPNGTGSGDCNFA